MRKDTQRFSNNIRIKNRKARFAFSFLDTFEAGIILKGTEIKSLREGKASIQEAYCYLRGGELFIKGMHIAPYTQAGFSRHDTTGDRKLLLKRKELDKLSAKTEEKGLTIVPLLLFISKRGFAKLEIALARGKKLFDKREDIKKKDQNRELRRMRLK